LWNKVKFLVDHRGKRHIGALTSAERRSLLIVIACKSAGGEFIPALIIFPRKNMSQILM
jgi:hypothetical protein